MLLRVIPLSALLLMTSTASAAATMASAASAVPGAQVDAAPADVPKRLDDLEAEIAVLKRELEVAKLKGELQKAQHPEPPSPMTFAAPSMRIPDPALPQVNRIAAFGRFATADLVYADGTLLTVRPGDRLPDGVKVMRIGAGGVLVRRGGVESPLRFAPPAPATKEEPGASSAPGGALPPLPLGATGTVPTIPTPTP